MSIRELTFLQLANYHVSGEGREVLQVRPHKEVLGGAKKRNSIVAFTAPVRSSKPLSPVVLSRHLA